jgi:hypothetical protein
LYDRDEELSLERAINFTSNPTLLPNYPTQGYIKDISNPIAGLGQLETGEASSSTPNNKKTNSSSTKK